jgi:formamidopyrimidine-DNA glycosylase
MPELPEVETTKRGVQPHIEQQRITALVVRQDKLRWPVSPELQSLVGETILNVRRRAKYLLIDTAKGSLMVHLGMSGSLRVIEQGEPPSFHDHVDLELGKIALRYTDPRRFGCWLFVAPNSTHKLLSELGPEPLEEDFQREAFAAKLRATKRPVKQAIMDNRIVVGVGNIYANEALFMANISPVRAANRVSVKRLDDLYDAIRVVLAEAIEQGGTTLKDFVGSDGQPGYFKQSLHVYGRGGLDCTKCKQTLKEIRLGGRSTVYCPNCQR